MKYVDGMLLYAYVRNNPIFFTDPMGLGKWVLKPQPVSIMRDSRPKMYTYTSGTVPQFMDSSNFRGGYIITSWKGGGNAEVWNRYAHDTWTGMYLFNVHASWFRIYTCDTNGMVQLLNGVGPYGPGDIRNYGIAYAYMTLLIN